MSIMGEEGRHLFGEQFRQLAVLVETGQVRVNLIEVEYEFGGYQTLRLEIAGSPSGIVSKLLEAHQRGS